MTDDDIKLLIAVTSDEKKAARLAELQDKLNEIEAAISKLNDIKAANQDVLDQTLKDRRAQVEMTEALCARQADLDAREEQMARVSEGIKNEQQRWETVVRQPTEAAHAQKAEDLTVREAAVSFREKEIAGLKEKLAAKEQAAAGMELTYTAMVAELNEIFERHSKAKE